MLESVEEIEKQLPAMKIWLIPSKTDEPKELHIVAKFYHFANDGLSIVQMFSLM